MKNSMSVYLKPSVDQCSQYKQLVEKLHEIEDGTKTPGKLNMPDSIRLSLITHSVR
jgi:hypothetical protein